MVNCAVAFEAFDCFQPKISKKYSASQVQACYFDKESVIKPIGKRKITLIQKDHYVSVPVTKCQLQYKAHIWNCVTSGDYYIKEDKYPVRVELTYEECKRAMSEKWMPLKVNNKKITNLKLGITVHRIDVYGWSDRTGYCSGDFTFTYMGEPYKANMVFYVRAKLVHEKETFNLKDGTLVSTGEECKIDDKYCILTTETLIIDPAWSRNFCAFSFL